MISPFPFQACFFVSKECMKCRFLKGLLAHPGNVVAATLALALTAIALSSLSQCSKSPARELPVSEKNAPFPRALQSNSHNYDPAHDLVFSKLTVSRVFFSGGVFISQTPVSRSIRTQTYPRGAAQGWAFRALKIGIGHSAASYITLRTHSQRQSDPRFAWSYAISFEPRRFGAFEPRRVRGHFLKPC